MSLHQANLHFYEEEFKERIFVERLKRNSPKMDETTIRLLSKIRKKQTNPTQDKELLDIKDDVDAYFIKLVKECNLTNVSVAYFLYSKPRGNMQHSESFDERIDRFLFEYSLYSAKNMNDLLELFQASKLDKFYTNDRIILKPFMIGYMEAYNELYNELLEIPQKITPIQKVKESFVKRAQTILFSDIKTLLSKSRELVKLPTTQELADEYYEKYFTESFEQESYFLTTEYGIRWHVWRIFDRFFFEPMAKSEHNWRQELGIEKP